MKITPAVSLLAICSTVALAQRAEDPRVVVVQSALRLAQSGKPAEACSQLRSISATPRDHVWATARLAIADIASSCAPPQTPEAIYDEVIQTGMPADAALARNNKGLLWLNSRPDDALKLFQDAAAAPASIPPDPNRGLYRTNLGAVYESRQQWSNALDAYRANAVEGLDLPATTASLSRIFVQIARTNALADWQASLARTAALLPSQQGLANGLSLIDAVAAEPAAATDQLSIAFVLAAGAAPYDPKAAVDTLNLLSKKPRLTSSIAELRTAASGDLSAPESSAEVAKLFANVLALPWSSTESTAHPSIVSRGNFEFARYLHRAADYHLAEQNHQGALACYTAAWLLDPADTAAARTTAFLLHDYPQLNPSGSLREVLARTYRPVESFSLLGGLFSVGGADSRPTQTVAADISEIYSYIGLSATGPGAAKSLEASLKLRSAGFFYRPDPAPLIYEQLGRIYERSQPAKAASRFLSAKRDFEIVGQPNSALAALKQYVALNPKPDNGFVLGELVPGQNALAGRVPLSLRDSSPVLQIQRSPVEPSGIRADRDGYFALPLSRPLTAGETVTVISNSGNVSERKTIHVSSTLQPLPAGTRLFAPVDGDMFVEGIVAPGIREVDVQVAFDQSRCGGANLAAIPRAFASGSVNSLRRSFQVSVGRPLLTGETVTVISPETGRELVHNDVAFSSDSDLPFAMKINLAFVYDGGAKKASYGYEYETALRRIYRRSNRYLCGSALADRQARVGAQLYLSFSGNPLIGTEKRSGTLVHGSGFSFPVGVHFPIVLNSWEYKRQRYSIFAAPLAEAGLDYFSDATNLYHKRPTHASVGLRLGSLSLARGLANVLDYVDALALFSNALRLPTDTPNQSRLAAFLQVRSVLQIPNTPI